MHLESCVSNVLSCVPCESEEVNSSVVYAWNCRLRVLGSIPARFFFCHQPSRQTAAKLLVQPDGSIVTVKGGGKGGGAGGGDPPHYIHPCSADVLICGCKGPQRAKGQFKDYEVGANYFVLLIVLCWWEGGVLGVVQFLW